MNKMYKMQNLKSVKYARGDPNFIQNSKSDILKQRQKRIIKHTNNNNNFNKYRSPSNKKINRYTPRNSNKNNSEMFDMRIFYCLKMLGLETLQHIFENNNISFDELLILSLKDLANLRIPKTQQIILILIEIYNLIYNIYFIN